MLLLFCFLWNHQQDVGKEMSLYGHSHCQSSSFSGELGLVLPDYPGDSHQLTFGHCCSLPESEPNDRCWLFTQKAYLIRVCLIQELKGLKRCALFWVWHWTHTAEKTTEVVGSLGKVTARALSYMENLTAGDRKQTPRMIPEFWFSFSGEQGPFSLMLGFHYVLC